MRTKFSCVCALLACVLLNSIAFADEKAGVRSEITTVFGYYGVTHGLSDRRFSTAWGNAYLSSGLGAHAEVHFMDREETASYFAGGLSWSGTSTSLRGWLGTSTGNDDILPELYARIEGIWRSSAETGFVVSPAATYRKFRNGAEEAIVEADIAKYYPLTTGYLILNTFGRVLFIDPGDHVTASFGAGVTYAQSRKVAIGVTVEAGRATYDGMLVPSTFDEPYVSLRPHVSFYITDKAEVVGLLEYSSRQSYDLYGGYVGLKLYFD